VKILVKQDVSKEMAFIGVATDEDAQTLIAQSGEVRHKDTRGAIELSHRSSLLTAHCCSLVIVPRLLVGAGWAICGLPSE
jgi:hypothetical protein